MIKPPPEQPVHVKETPVETEEAVVRIKKAVSDAGENIQAEKDGTKAAHVPPHWARKGKPPAAPRGI